MSRCNRCNIDVLDNSYVCPLCNGVLDQATTTDYQSKSNMYPNVMPKLKKLKLFIKIFVFASIVVEGILILINCLTDSHFKWSLICGVVLAYACFTVIFSSRRDRGHRIKLFMQAVVAMLLVYLIDIVIGYNGWSLDYAIPCIIMSVDGVIIILMFTNIRYWQNYLLLQIMMLLVSIIFVVLAACDLVKHPALTIIAAAVSGLCLLGSIVFGDKKAVGELTRRFRM
ncbi:MAG: DUF6320 domain-containing protein [Clostridium sp.]|nr:DUF6320 domain-containing protein [Clostridium sp.]MCM1399220.1 DUF6320 domain-containing protein [Clostridium sp.]MCM1459242.1 DUF6320 domain-containing protein [Bacteroides sp.]